MTRNADRWEREDPHQRRRKYDQKPWWHAHVGLMWTLVAAAVGAFVTVKVQLAQQQQVIDSAPARRDREIDQLIARLAAVESRRCAQ